MNSEFCRLCIRKEKSRLVNALSIPELCKSVKCFLGLEILATDKCSTFICRQCISIITESISYRNRVLFNQETIKEQLLLQLQLENVDIKKEEEDGECTVIDSDESYQDLDNQPLSVLKSYLSANSNKSGLKRTAQESTAKLPMVVFPPTKKICTRRLKVVCMPLMEKDVAHVYLDMKTRRLLKLNGKLAVRRIERKQTEKQMERPIENDTKEMNLCTRSSQSMLSGKVCASGGTNSDVPPAQLNSKTNQAPRIEPNKISQNGSTAYRADTCIEKQSVKSASINVAELGSIQVQAAEVIASQMSLKPATGTPMGKKNRPNGEQLVPFSAVNPIQPSNSKELSSVEMIKIENTKLPVGIIQSNALQPSSKQLVPNRPISKQIVPKETLANFHRKFVNILPKSSGNLSISPTLKTSIVLNSVGNLSASSTAVTATRTEPRNAAATQTPPTTTSPIVVSPNVSIPNLNYFPRFLETPKNIETIANGKLPMVNVRSNVSTTNSYQIPVSIIMANNSNQPAERVSNSSSSMSSPSTTTVNSVNVGHFRSENRVKILTVNELNTRANITQPAGCGISGCTGNYNACKLPIRISLSRLKNEMSMKLFDSRGNEVNYQTLTESEKEAVKIRLVSMESVTSINKAFQLCAPDMYTVELLKMFGLNVSFFKNSQI